jgi:hypothetical protein
MAAPARLSLRPALGLLCLPTLAGLLLSAWPGGPLARPRSVHPDDWSLAELVQHLEARGLGLRAVPTGRAGGSSVSNVFLIRGGKKWEDLGVLSLNPVRIHQWQGVVYCERVANPDTAEHRAQDWASDGLWVGPFLFFGDRGLREEIHTALTAGAPSED